LFWITYCSALYCMAPCRVSQTNTPNDCVFLMLIGQVKGVPFSLEGIWNFLRYPRSSGTVVYSTELNPVVLCCSLTLLMFTIPHCTCTAFILYCTRSEQFIALWSNKRRPLINTLGLVIGQNLPTFASWGKLNTKLSKTNEARWGRNKYMKH